MADEPKKDEPKESTPQKGEEDIAMSKVEQKEENKTEVAVENEVIEDANKEPIKDTTAKASEEAALSGETTEVVESSEPTGSAIEDGVVGGIYPEVVPGTLVRVHQKIKEVNPKGEEKERVQVFEGTVLQRKHGSEPGATITVRKVSNGVGVEKIFPLRMPSIEKIEVKKKFRVRRAKLSFLRLPKFKKRLKEIKEAVTSAK